MNDYREGFAHVAAARGATRASAGLPGAPAVLLGNFNQLYKIDPPQLAAWGEARAPSLLLPLPMSLLYTPSGEPQLAAWGEARTPPDARRAARACPRRDRGPASAAPEWGAV